MCISGRIDIFDEPGKLEYCFMALVHISKTSGSKTPVLINVINHCHPKSVALAIAAAVVSVDPAYVSVCQFDTDVNFITLYYLAP